MFKTYKNQFLLHLIVLIWGFTAVIGKLVTLGPTVLVWYRSFFAVIGMLAFLKFKKQDLKTDHADILKFLGVGVIVALHWIFFFQAVKVSNVSVTLACLSSGALFASLLEPLFYRRKIVMTEIVFGLFAVIGLSLIFRFESRYHLGMIYSLLAAFSSALFMVLNGKLTKKHNGTVISFYEMLGAFLGLTVFLLVVSSDYASLFVMSASDLFYLLVLGWICTAFAFVTSVEILKELSPFTVVLTINLEPVYGILLAFFVFGESERMTGGFYAGTILVLATIFLNGWIRSRQKRALSVTETQVLETGCI